MPDTQPDNKVTLEALLRLKRHEKPAPEFWESFDRELHQKMLHTLVRKDPLVIRWIRSLYKRLYIVVPSAAAAVITLVIALQGDVVQKTLHLANASTLEVASKRSGFTKSVQGMYGANKTFVTNALGYSHTSSEGSQASALRVVSSDKVNYVVNTLGQSSNIASIAQGGVLF